jgi:predicted SnoaL-like aldol condensation-catalyzing enzyme
MSPTRLSKIESALRTVLAFNSAFNQHDIPAMLELLSDNCSFESHSPAPNGAVFTGKQAIGQYFQDLFQNYPQARLKTEDAFGLGYHCIARWQLTWTDAAGGEHHLRGADIYKVEDSLICEKYSYVKTSSVDGS